MRNGIWIFLSRGFPVSEGLSRCPSFLLKPPMKSLPKPSILTRPPSLALKPANTFHAGSFLFFFPGLFGRIFLCFFLSFCLDLKALKAVWKHATITKEKKIRVFDACIVSGLLYGVSTPLLDTRRD